MERCEDLLTEAGKEVCFDFGWNKCSGWGSRMIFEPTRAANTSKFAKTVDWDVRMKT
jgi:hypothetical protein